MKCHNCSWSWKIEKDDNHPFLCHKCGYDSELGDFNMVSFNKWKKENGYPFTEYIEEGFHIRTFFNNIDNTELVWHRDKEDRIVESIGDTDWLIHRWCGRSTTHPVAVLPAVAALKNNR